LDDKFDKNKYYGIVFPRARFHYTSCDDVVLPHCDWENADNSLSSFVASFCRYVQVPSVDGVTTIIRRTGFHGYGCQALENCQQRYNKLQQSTVTVSKFYNGLPKLRRVVNEELLVDRSNRQWYRFTPHVSKIVGLSCFADCIIRFSQRNTGPRLSLSTYIGLCFNTIACESPDHYVNYLDQLIVVDDNNVAWSMYKNIFVSKSNNNNNNNSNNEQPGKRQMHQPTHNKIINEKQYVYNIKTLGRNRSVLYVSRGCRRSPEPFSCSWCDGTTCKRLWRAS